MLRLLVDFNEIRDGVVRGLPEDVDGGADLVPGDHIVLHDGGEHEALGTVERLDNDLIYVQINMVTFGPPGRLMVTRHSMRSMNTADEDRIAQPRGEQVAVG
jgi:hypothetical protein